MPTTVPARRLTRAEDGAVLAGRIVGDGPAVLLVHGFPGTSYSWRHQLPALAAAGYRAIAVDTRGYGASHRTGPPAFTSRLIESDLIAVLDALDVERAVVVGQDFGAQYAWNLAQRSLDRVRAVLATVPFGGDPGPEPPTARFAAVAERHFLHLHYFQEAGRAEADLGGEHLREFLLRLFHALAAGGGLLAAFGHPDGTSYLDALPAAPPLPWPWLSEAEFEEFVAAYATGGGAPHPRHELTGGLASYRAADLDWEEAKRWVDVPVAQPSLLVMGEHDPVRTFAPPDLDQQRRWLTGLQGVVDIPQAGHHVQQEQPAAFDEVLLDFLARLSR